MKNVYQKLLKVAFITLAVMIPIVFYGQSTNGKEKVKDNSFEKYWSVNLNVGPNLFYGDLNVYDYYPVMKYNNMWKLGYGLVLTRQFSPVFGVRGQLLNGELSGTKRTINRYSDMDIFEYNLNGTVNFSNLIWHYKPERKLTVYGFVGIGMANWETRLYRLSDDVRVGGNGQDGAGPGKRTTEAVIPAGLGLDYSINEKWGINLEGSYRVVNSDKLDATEGDYKYDAYSYNSLGVTYKFKESANLKSMAKNYDKVKITATPTVLETLQDSIEVTISGTFPEKYFSKKAVMNFTPVLKYPGGSTTLKGITLQGEKMKGECKVINYKEGGNFTYTQKIPYNPAMNTSDLVVTPIIYTINSNETVKCDASINEIKQAKKNIELPEQKLADGVIYTSTKAIFDEDLNLTDPGYVNLDNEKIDFQNLVKPEYENYVKANILQKDAKIYFKVNLSKLDFKLPLNKTNLVEKKLKELTAFINKGYKIREIAINAWASPEGDVSYNQNLSEARKKTATTYMYDVFKKLAKDKKSLVKIAHPETAINFVTAAHGEDWDGFMKSVQASSIKDKNRIANIVNSQSDLNAREREIRKMTVVYKEVEEQILPPLRRAEISVYCQKAQRTEEEMQELSLNKPDSVTVEEILYSATLTKDTTDKMKMYKNAIATYPNDWRAYNNAAYYDFKQSNTKEANGFLEKANSLNPNNATILYNLGVLASRNKNFDQSAAYFNKAQKAGANVNYELGFISLKKGDYTQAQKLISAKKCNYNLGLVQLITKDYQSAANTFKCAPANANTYYMMAVTAARTNNTSLMYENLIKAFKANPTLKATAKNDREFIKYFNAPDFQNVIK